MSSCEMSIVKATKHTNELEDTMNGESTPNTDMVPAVDRKKSRRIRDTVVVKIPKNETIDLGIAMKQSREKRLNKLRIMYPELFPQKNPPDGENQSEEDKESDSKNLSGSSKKKKKGKLSKNRTDVTVPRREQYGSTLDYLEAKYVRGVMLDNLDDKIKRKKKDLKKERARLLKQSKDNKQKMKEIGAGDEANDDHKQSVGNEESDKSDGSSSDSDGDGEGSYYSDASGFLDDSLLRTSIAEQVVAQGSTTKLEADLKKKNDNGDGENNSNTSGGGDDYDGFFVNVGDLEMADESEYYEAGLGFGIDNDHLSSGGGGKSKRRKQKDSGKKRKRKDKAPSFAKSSNKQPKKLKTTATGNDKSKSSMKTTPTMTATPKAAPTKKKLKRDGNTPKTAKPTSPISTGLSPPRKEKRPQPSSKPVKNDNGEGKNDDDDDDDEDEVIADLSKNGSLYAEAYRIRSKCETLKKEQKRLYKLVVKEIKKMTVEDLPRKNKKKDMIKVSIVIPLSKKAGDEIQFSNPKVPGQRLKVKVPESGVPGKSFVVSVPVQQQRPLINNNKFNKATKEALDTYSKAYDEWIEMEAKWHAVAPNGNRKYRPNNERLKKFDDMVNEFPSDLAHPIDAPFLRKVVRRVRQNSSKRRKIDAEAEATGIKEKFKNTIKIKVPMKGVVFPIIAFDDGDFFRP